MWASGHCDSVESEWRGGRKAEVHDSYKFLAFGGCADQIDVADVMQLMCDSFGVEHR